MSDTQNNNDAARDAGQNPTSEYRYGWLGRNDLRVRIDDDGEIEAMEYGYLGEEQVGRGDILSTPGDCEGTVYTVEAVQLCEDEDDIEKWHAADK